jgi:hypothetical protein
MKTAKELYPSGVNDSYLSLGDYQPILNSFGRILIQVDDDDYEGDSRVLYKKDKQYGYLQFGWGSCSGCDALQACASYEEADELITNLFNSIKWFENKKEALIFFKTHDWGGDYSWNFREQKEFVDRVIELLG